MNQPISSQNPVYQRDLRILVVEDNPEDLHLLRSLMICGESGNLAVENAGRLDEAIAMLADRDVDLILLDLDLPDSFGLETLKRMAESTPNIPIVVLTGNQDLDIAMTAMHMGAEDFLSKDEMTEHLLQRTIRHVVERFQMVHELERSRENFLRMSESLPDPILILDQNDRVLYANRSARSVFDPHLQGMQQKKLQLPRLHGRIGEFNHKNILGVSRTMEIRDTQTNWGGEPARLVLLRDLTELETQRQELNESRMRFSDFFDSLSSAVLLLGEEDSGANFRIVDLNTASTVLITPDRENAINQNLLDVLPCMTACPVYQLIRDTALDGRHRSLVEIQCTHAEFPGYRNVQCFKLTDGTVALVVDDVTEKVRRDQEYQRMDEQLRQMQKLESIGRMVGGIAHDFNNILAGITSYGELIVSELHEKDPLRNDVRDLIQTAERGASLTSQLLAFSRRQMLQPVTLDVNQAMNSLDNLIRRLIGEDIQLRIESHPEIWPVYVDNSQFDQVFLNLATNARDAMVRGGKLTIRIENITLETVLGTPPETIPPGDYTVFHVTDTGEGVPAEIRNHLFEPFFSTKGKGKGTGLGLSTVWGIVRQSQGLITLDSAPGEGTVFHIYLPRSLKPASVTLDKVQRKAPGRGQGERVLVVEDETMILELIYRLLSRHGYNVVKARNPGEALLLCENIEKKPELLIADVVMPEMDGPFLLERLRQLIPDLKVIFMSGYADDIMENRGLDVSGVPFIQKPFKADRLLYLVCQVLSRPG